jgi:hypothetical protein
VVNAQITEILYADRGAASGSYAIPAHPYPRGGAEARFGRYAIPGS